MISNLRSYSNNSIYNILSTGYTAAVGDHVRHLVFCWRPIWKAPSFVKDVIIVDNSNFIWIVSWIPGKRSIMQFRTRTPRFDIMCHTTSCICKPCQKQHNSLIGLLYGNVNGLAHLNMITTFDLLTNRHGQKKNRPISWKWWMPNGSSTLLRRFTCWTQIFSFMGILLAYGGKPINPLPIKKNMVQSNNCLWCFSFQILTLLLI